MRHACVPFFASSAIDFNVWLGDNLKNKSILIASHSSGYGFSHMFCVYCKLSSEPAMTYLKFDSLEYISDEFC